jgi:serine/threonine protein kinase
MMPELGYLLWRPVKTGTRLATTFEQYEVLGPIGSGGSGDVMLAQAGDGTRVAIKALRPNQPRSKLNRFRNELSFCLNDVHPNIVRVLDHGIYQGVGGDQPFYVMPLYESTLRKELATKRSAKGTLELYARILDGVEAAHLLRIVHRDLKPENILINPSSDEVVVADFGIAHFEEENLAASVETGPADRVGNWEYAAPEQRRPGQNVDHRADIYALGLILVELFTGAVPHGANPQTIASAAPEFSYLDGIADAMRQNAVDRRPESIARIKGEMIAQGLAFIERQKLDELNKIVIPASQVSDPLSLNPITLVDAKYRSGALHFTLSAPPNRGWIQNFQNMGGYAAVVGSEPHRISFSGNVASLPANPSSAQMVVNHFKNWLQLTNDQYSLAVRTQTENAEREERRRLREEQERRKAEIETNERVNSQLKW